MKEMIEKNKVLQALTDIYYCNYIINLQDNTYVAYKEQDDAHNLVGSYGDAILAFDTFIKTLVEDSDRDEFKKFVDFKTLKTRLNGQNNITYDYRSINNGWCRGRFIPIFAKDNDYDYVIFVVEAIDEEKKKELKQKYELEVTNTNLQNKTEIINVLSESFYVICHIDFKNGSCHFLTNTEKMNKLINGDMFNVKEHSKIIDYFVDEKYQASVKLFLNENSLVERLLNTNEVSIEYKDKYMGWCVLEVQVAKRNALGIVEAALLTSRVINNEKLQMEDYNFLKKQVQEERQSNKKLIYLTEHDTLTDLYNREGYNRIKETLRYKHNIGLIVLDIDYFKNINDEYGHNIGDEVLINFSKIMKNKFRAFDYIIRYGGDEFIVILRNITDLNYEVIKNKIICINKELQESSTISKVSVSAGVAFSKDGFTEKLFQHADEALYRAKDMGRSICELYQETEENVKQVNTEETKKTFSETVYYEGGNNDVIIENYYSEIDSLLEKNNAVGIACGFFEDGLPLYSISNFALTSLNYSYDDFQKNINNNFINLVYCDDRKTFVEYMTKLTNDKCDIRLVNGEGKIVWFQILKKKVKNNKNELMWILSLRRVDDLMLGFMCENDYMLIGMIDCKSGELNLEKLSTKLTDKSPKNSYKYQEILKYEIENKIRKEDRATCLKNLSLDNVIYKLEHSEIYECIVYHLFNNKYQAIRHKFRYYDKSQGLIIMSEENVAIWAEQDDLCGVLNETGFYNAVSQVLMNEDNDYSIIYCNIKDFKLFNSKYGVSTANLILKVVGKNIEKSAINPIYVSRFGADHFACLVSSNNINDKNLLDFCNQKVLVEEKIVPLVIKCGIYKIEKGEILSGNLINDNVRTMCDKAIIASNNVGNDERKSYYIYDNKLKKQYYEDALFKSELDSAFEKKEFEVYYQPLYSTMSKKIVSAEALIRWNNEKYGLISPGRFIPILEKNGNITKLDLYVHKEIQEFIKKRIEENKYICSISMNLSRKNFSDDNAFEQILNCINNDKLAKKYIYYEITESAYVDNEEVEKILELKSYNAKVAIDDFGVGYSSLSNIVKYEFDIIKLDRSFIESITKNERIKMIVKSIIETAHNLGCKVVAEGVESEEEYNFLNENKCDYIQGYYFSKPVCEKDFIELLDKYDN